MDVGCSLHSQKRTVAIASATNPQQLPVALSMASRVLRAAKTINNMPTMVLFGTGLGDVRPSSVANVQLLNTLVETGVRDRNGLLAKKAHIVVGAHDLAMLRLMPSRRVGEVCRVPRCDDVLCGVPPSASELARREVEEVVQCLLRPPPIEYKDVADLPLEWREHVEHLPSFEWVRDLWKQSLDDLKLDTPPPASNEEPREPVPSPFDVLSLCMYSKLASIAFRTTDMTQSVLRAVVVAVDGAVDAGLLSVFPRDGVAPTFLEFVEQYLLGDDYPWQVSARGAKAAAKARLVLERTFAHCERLASVMSKSNLALLLEDDVGPVDERAREPILLVHGGPEGVVAKLLANRLPIGAEAVGGAFRVKMALAPKGEWTSRLNQEFAELLQHLSSAEDTASSASSGSASGAVDRSVVKAQKANDASLSGRLAAYVALSSKHLASSDAIKNEPESSVLFSASPNVVSTYPYCAASHVSRELVVRNDFLSTRSTIGNVALQPGTSVACTFVTFCPTMAKTLSTAEFSESSFSSTNLSESQQVIERIAASLDAPDAPLGRLTGVLGGVVEVDGAQHRLAFWRAGQADEHDSFVTFLPKEFVDIAFADYATGSRALDPNELHKESKLPFFAADTVVTVFASMALEGSDGMAFRIPRADRLPVLDGDERTLYETFEASVRGGIRQGRALALPPSLGAGMRTFLVREAANDRLSGLRVAWSRRSVRETTAEGRAGRGLMTVLVSANTASERVGY